MNMKKILKFGIPALGICLLFAFALTSTSLQNASDGFVFENDYPIMTISSHGTYPYYSYEELTEKSDLIVVGKITYKEDAKWSTKDEKQPKKIRTEVSTNKHGDKVYDYYVDILPEETIYTDMVFSVETIYKGKLESKDIIIRSFGGTVGSFKMEDILNPDDFSKDEKTILYLVKDDGSTKNIGPEHYVVLPGGKLTEKDDVYINTFFGEKVDLKDIISLTKK